MFFFFELFVLLHIAGLSFKEDFEWEELILFALFKEKENMKVIEIFLIGSVWLIVLMCYLGKPQRKVKNLR